MYAKNVLDLIKRFDHRNYFPCIRHASKDTMHYSKENCYTTLSQQIFKWAILLSDKRFEGYMT